MQLVELEKRIHNHEFTHKRKDFIIDTLNMMPKFVKIQSEIVTMNKKDILYQKGEVPNYSYFIISGEITVVSEFESGRIYEPIILRDDDITGFVEAILDKQEILSTNITTTDVELIRVPNNVVKKWLSESAEFTNYLLKKVSEYFYTNMEWSGQNVILGSKYLFVNYLLNHAKPDETMYILNETREKTAKRTGINLRTLYRYINEFKELDIITTQGRKIIFTTEGHNQLVDLYMQLRNTL